MNEQLEILDKALADLRVNYAENAWHLFLWGGLILAGCALNYLLIAVFERGDLISRGWMVLIGTGAAIEIVHGVRSRPSGRSASYIEKSIGLIWGLLGVSMLAIAFVAPATGLLTYLAIIPLLMIQIWIGTLFTGLMIRFRPLAVLSNVWLLSAAIILFVPNANQLLLMAACILVGYLLPAFLLRAEGKH